MVEDTCNTEKCYFAELIGDPEKCPNFVVNVFTPVGKEGPNEPVFVRDCAPRRTLIMIQDLHNRMTGMQSAIEQSRNKNDSVLQLFKMLIDKYINSNTIRGDEYARISK